MEIPIDFEQINELLETAAGEDRDILFEHEVYALLVQSGAETPPKCLFVPRDGRLTDEELTSLPGDRVVIKIVSPTIIHKTEVQGVQIVDQQPAKIRSTIRRMLYEVPEHYSLWLKRNKDTVVPAYLGLDDTALMDAISQDIKGILLVQYMQPDSEVFGNELIVGLRMTREFGMVITAGLGGTDTELYAERFRKGQAIVAASTRMHDGQSFFDLFRGTIAYKKLAGLVRGQRRIVTDEQLIECFESFIQMGNHYSPLGKSPPFVIDELEINPFAFTDYLMVPLDGMCRFSRPVKSSQLRSASAIENLLHPKQIGIIGVSAKRKNFGRVIVDNILAEGFSQKQLTIIHEDTENIDGISCIPALAALSRQLDLLIIAVGSASLPELVKEIIDRNSAAAVMLISGGLGETEESKGRAVQVVAQIRQGHEREEGGPLFLGANCMGVISHPGGYDSWFIPKERLPKERTASYHRSALISQSGAFMLNRSHQFPEIRPAYMISMGNQTDLTLGDMLNYFKTSTAVDVIAIYAEGFNDLDGLVFCQAVREAVLAGKEVIFYKAGRTAAGKAATSGHTASLAGDYMVCESCVRQAGAVVARTFTEFQELLFMAEVLNNKRIAGNRLAAISGAGFEAVGMADSIESDDYQVRLARFSRSTEQRIATILEAKNLRSLVTISNPLDINPAADDEAHALIAEAVSNDASVDAVVISLDPLSPVMHTLSDAESTNFSMDRPDSIKNRIITLASQSEKPVIAIVDGGRSFDPLRQALIQSSIPVFVVCDRAVAVLSLYIQGRLRAEAIRKGGRTTY